MQKQVLRRATLLLRVRFTVIYKGEELIDTYTTDENGQFTTKYYICDNDWTVREISRPRGIFWIPQSTR